MRIHDWIKQPTVVISLCFLCLSSVHAATEYITQTVYFPPGPYRLVAGIPTGIGVAVRDPSSNITTQTVAYTTTTPDVCSVSTTGSPNTQGIVTGIKVGTCQIVATAPLWGSGEKVYLAAWTIVDYTVSQIIQTISFPPGPYNLVAGIPTGIGVGVRDPSSNITTQTVVYTTTTPDVCSVSTTGSPNTQGTATGIKAGTCTVVASVPATVTYAAAQATMDYTVSQGAQTISFNFVATLTVGGVESAFATSSAGLAVHLSSITPNVCTISGNTVTALVSGICSIAANQVGNADYRAAAQVIQSIAVGAGAQAISFGIAPSLAVGGTGTLTATGGASGNAVTFASTTPLVCTVAGSTVTALIAGNCVVSANQAGNANYSAAPQGTQNITVGKSDLDLLQGWNLLGNGQDQSLNVATLLGDSTKVITVWKWDTLTSGWQFFAPSMNAAALQTYATSKGYGVLSTVNPGEGFWVNAAQAFASTLPSGNAIGSTAFQPSQAYALKTGWNLISVGSAVSPSALNAGLSATPPAAGVVAPNITTLWAWDNPQAKWYFYAPNLEGQGGTAMFDYITNKGYLDFTATSKTLGNGTGFWVNKP